MIPKKIHYCWLSEDEMPIKIKKCIESWKKNLPDYEFILWDKNKININNYPWVLEAYNAKKYAFAADFIRCFALYTEGGIYLDSDVEVIKPFDDLLNLPYFIGQENGGVWEAATIGAEQNMLLFKKMLEYYDGRHFNNNNCLDTKPLPKILREIAEQNYNIKYIKDFSCFDKNSCNLQIVPFDFFSPKSLKTHKLESSARTYSIHHFEGSWLPKKLHVKKKISIRFPRLVKLFSKIKNFILLK